MATPPAGSRSSRATASGSPPARSASCSCRSWAACGRPWSRPRPRSWWSAWPRTGRFKVTMGDTINVFLAQQRLDRRRLPGRQGRPRGRRALQGGQYPGRPLHAGPGQALHGRAVLRGPARGPRGHARRSSCRPRPCGPPIRARGSRRAAPRTRPQAKQRSLLQRLLGGDLEAGSYSTGENSLPLREVAKFKFPVLAMDVAVAPKDKIPAHGGQRRRSDLHVPDRRSEGRAGVEPVGAQPGARVLRCSSRTWTATAPSRSSATGTRRRSGSTPS